MLRISLLNRMLVAGFVVAAAAGAAVAQDVKFFRIGTGGTAGTYYPIGGLIANAISNPPGSRPCNDGGSCGAPGVVATAVASNGSVANINGIQSGQLESGFTQSDAAYWAFSGTGVYEGKPKVADLRLIGNLYPETIHLVARKGANIKSVADLKGKKVSLDEPGSGTLVDARLILSAFGLNEKDLKAEYFRAQQVADSLKDGTIDAFFRVSGWPQSSVADLAATVGIELVPIAGPEVDSLVAQFPFFSVEEVPENAYRGVAGVKTVRAYAIRATSIKQSEELIYKVTAALWNPATRKLLDSGHAKGREIRLETATTGLGIPPHPGAEKFYKEQGLIR